MSLIHDGRTNNTVHIDANNRMQTSSITDPIQDWACGQNVKYNINTGDITITNTTKYSPLYIKNEEDDDLVITALIYNIGTSTNGAGDSLIEVLRNPTAGGAITNANDVDVGPGVTANQNFGSTRLLAGKFYKGAQGEAAFSASDGVTITTRAGTGPSRVVVSLGAVILPKNASLGINFTPPGSNTSQTCQFAVACYLKTSAVEAI